MSICSCIVGNYVQKHIIFHILGIFMRVHWIEIIQNNEHKEAYEQVW